MCNDGFVREVWVCVQTSADVRMYNGGRRGRAYVQAGYVCMYSCFCGYTISEVTGGCGVTREVFPFFVTFLSHPISRLPNSPTSHLSVPSLFLYVGLQHCWPSQIKSPPAEVCMRGVEAIRQYWMDLDSYES